MSLCYNEKTTEVVESGQYSLDKKCNGYTAVNVGDTIATVNGKPIKPPILPTLSGESTGIGGNYDEIFVGNNGQILVNFLPPMGTNPKVLMIEKIYL